MPIFLDSTSSPCYFALNGTHGSINSDFLGDQLACRWVITTSAHQNIRLNFTLFQLSDDASIKVYNGNSEKSYLLGTFTGTRHRFVVHTNSRFMLVKLTKKYSDSLCKFEAVFTSSTSKGKLWYIYLDSQVSNKSHYGLSHYGSWQQLTKN